MVVPSLNELLRMTELPTLTGMSSMSPSMVERMSVVLMLALLSDMPSRTMPSASSALFFSASACLKAISDFSNSSVLITFSS